jgi:hypothetical protein
MVQQCSRQPSSYSPPWEPENSLSSSKINNSAVPWARTYVPHLRIKYAKVLSIFTYLEPKTGQWNIVQTRVSPVFIPTPMVHLQPLLLFQTQYSERRTRRNGNAVHKTQLLPRTEQAPASLQRAPYIFPCSTARLWIDSEHHQSPFLLKCFHFLTQSRNVNKLFGIKTRAFIYRTDFNYKLSVTLQLNTQNETKIIHSVHINRSDATFRRPTFGLEEKHRSL